MTVWRALGVILLALQALACRERGNVEGGALASASASARVAARCEHGVPPALCPKCNPALAAVYQAKGDWCGEHGFPKSFCPGCDPNSRFPEVGAAPAAVAADWCGGHGLPESKCTKCNPELTAKFQASGNWCAEHGFPKSACPVCNPQQPPRGGAVADWCVEHGLPESKCAKCNPELVPALKAAGDWCNEHGFPESACPICNPQPPPAGAEQAAIEARVVRFRSAEIEDTAGLRTVAAAETSAAAGVECAARLAFDSDRVADSRAIVPGIVRRVRVELGATVERGAPLFELESARVGEIQGALQAARERVRTADANLNRQRELRAGGVTSARELEVAEQELASAQAEARTAEATLRIAGAAQSAPSGRYTLTAPIAGTVVRRPAVVGLMATESELLATIADTQVMWALCEVSEADAGRISLGQTMHVTTEPGTEVVARGPINWIAAEVDPRTRTVSARAVLQNPQGRLRANQFARARIETGASRRAVSVPAAAVQRVGKHEVVFVRASPGVYEPRIVLRHGHGDPVQVEGRLRQGEAVVTTGAILLRTEIMPGSIGAGCCEVEPPGSR